MRRFALCFGLCLLVAAETGCCRPKKCNYGCSGCGERYLGAYVDDPPRCEPCDDCGNWTGSGCGSSSCCGSKGRGGFLESFFVGPFFGGDEGCCDGCATESCTESSCGEAGCGDPNCGCGGSGGGILDGQYLSVKPRWSNIRPVSRSQVVETAGGCNCGRH